MVTPRGTLLTEMALRHDYFGNFSHKVKILGGGQGGPGGGRMGTRWGSQKGVRQGDQMEGSDGVGRWGRQWADGKEETHSQQTPSRYSVA